MKSNKFAKIVICLFNRIAMHGMLLFWNKSINRHMKSSGQRNCTPISEIQVLNWKIALELFGIWKMNIKWLLIWESEFHESKKVLSYNNMIISSLRKTHEIRP